MDCFLKWDTDAEGGLEDFKKKKKFFFIQIGLKCFNYVSGFGLFISFHFYMYVLDVISVAWYQYPMLDSSR